MAAADSFDVSVVVPTFNRRDRLLRVLAALEAQETDTGAGPSFRFEVVVVSDGSTDGTAAAVRGFDALHPLRLIEQPNSGPAVARNAGIEAARGEVVVFIDDDVIPEPGCLAAHVAHHRRDPDVVVIGPMSTPPDHQMSAWVAWEQHNVEKWYPFFEARQDAGYHHFYTGNASVRRDRLRAAGGFDTSLLRAEDIELAHRLELLGCSFVFELRAGARHYAERSLASWRDIAHQYGVNEVRFSAPGRMDRLAEVARKHRSATWIQQRAVERLAWRPRPRRAVATAAETVAIAAHRVGMRRVGRVLLSGGYALRYFGGVADELGSRRAFDDVLHGSESGPPVVGFVIEQALGHVTHGQNLEELLRTADDIVPVFVPVDQTIDGWHGRVPGWSNWTVQAGLRARWALWRHQRRHPDRRFDALFVHTQVPAVLLGGWMRRIPTVVSLDATPQQYDELGESYSHARGPDRIERIKDALNRRTFDRARHLVTWSQWAKDGLVEGYGVPAEKITVLAPGVDVRQWSVAERELRSGDPVRILFVGGDLDRKGGEVLLEAVERLRRTPGLPDVEVDLVTRSPVDDRPGVTVHHGLGPNSAELRALYAGADIFCLPTLGDCLPMVLAEAGAAGLPLVSTDVGAIGEVVRPGETGLLVAPGDVAGLADALGILVSDAELRTRLGHQARRLVSDGHDARANGEQVLRLVAASVDGPCGVPRPTASRRAVRSPT